MNHALQYAVHSMHDIVSSVFNKISRITRRNSVTAEPAAADVSTPSESETSSSEDETASNVSLENGMNPCKCCMCEDCDLRSHCLFIGLFEIVFWLGLTIATFFIGLLSRGSEPVIYTDNSTEPLYGRNKKNLKEGASSTKRPRFGYAVVAGRRSFVNPEPILEGDGEGSVNNSNTVSNTSYELILRSQIGDVVLLFKPDTEEGLKYWQRNMENFYWVLVTIFVLVVVLSIISGMLCLNGAYYRKTYFLLAHTVMALITGIFIMVVGGVMAAMYAFGPFIFSTFLFFLYIYFAVCSYGLVTIIKSGAYDDFIVDGITYTYSTILRAKVRVDKDGNTGPPKISNT